MHYGEELKKVQKIELEILADVIRVCDENNIEFFVASGTALGAVRHGGFIPWDDDIDIGMTRDNYERFLTIAPSKLKKGLFLQHYTTEPDSPTYFAKVRRDNTRFVEYYTRNIKMHHGVYIDIFPYDQVPDDHKLRKRLFRKAFFIHQLFIAKSVTGTSTPQRSLRGLLGKGLRLILHYILKPIPKKWLFHMLDKEVKKYNNYPLASSLSYIVDSPRVIIERKVLFPLKPTKFESLTVKIPNLSEEYLTHHYGDYLQLPPMEERVGHRPFILEL
ncbi:MAG: LicD family protein [Thermoanaerobacteraceae bacterium]|nr:LicD family protein [Thermoanaerobacteraceae bacterium]